MSKKKAPEPQVNEVEAIFAQLQQEVRQATNSAIMGLSASLDASLKVSLGNALKKLKMAQAEIQE